MDIPGGQWLRILLPVQGTWFWEESTRLGAIKTHMQQILSPHSRAHRPQLLKPTYSEAHALQEEKSLQREACTLQLGSNLRLSQLEKSLTQQQRPRTAKINK